MRKETPYTKQPAKAFWRETVSQRRPLRINDWYFKRWAIGDSRISAAGSCFAQHLGRYLQSSGFRYMDFEPPPKALNAERHLDYGYGMYSARFGNIYTVRQLLQLLQRANGEFKPQEMAWELNGGFVDPFRPTIEPDPLRSIAEVEACRASHLRAVTEMFANTDLFVFTLGLTEAWRSKIDGAVFPVCPGTQGGSFDSAHHEFVNFTYPEILQDLLEFIARARAINSGMRFILTVSPVPLVATATANQVVVASSYSKSVLRGVAGYVSDTLSYVDYFPSYEIISASVMRGRFYDKDRRSVLDAGVEHVMKQFFAEHTPPGRKVEPRVKTVQEIEEERERVICDEQLLEAFGEGKK